MIPSHILLGFLSSTIPTLIISHQTIHQDGSTCHKMCKSILTAKSCLKSASLNLNGIFETCNLFGPVFGCDDVGVDDDCWTSPSAGKSVCCEIQQILHDELGD